MTGTTAYFAIFLNSPPYRALGYIHIRTQPEVRRSPVSRILVAASVTANSLASCRTSSSREAS